MNAHGCANERRIVRSLACGLIFYLGGCSGGGGGDANLPTTTSQQVTVASGVTPALLTGHTYSLYSPVPLPTDSSISWSGQYSAKPTPKPAAISTPTPAKTPSSTRASSAAGSFQSLPQFADSVFTQLLPANPQLAPNGAQQLASYGNIAIQDGNVDRVPSQYDLSAGIYWATNSDPLYTINCNAWSGNSCPSLQGKQIHIPTYAKWGAYPAPNCSGCPTHGNFDGQMVVISPDGTMEYDFWQADLFPGASGSTNFTISSGEAFPIAQGNEFGPSGWTGAATASHRALTAGILLPSDLTNGVISHALTIAPPCVNGQNVFPGVGGSGILCNNGTGLPQGSRLFLAMTDAQISALGLSQTAKIFYTAIAHYGVYVTDTSGENSTWYMVGTPNVHSWTDLGTSDPWPAAASPVGVSNVNYGEFTEYPIDLSFPPGLQNYLKVADPCVTVGGPSC